MWPVALGLIGFAWGRFQWVISLQDRLFTVLTGSESCHRILAAASRQIFSSGSVRVYISLIVATWVLSTLLLVAVSLGWVLGMVMYRSFRWLTRRASKKRPTGAALGASAATPQKMTESLASFVAVVENMTAIQNSMSTLGTKSAASDRSSSSSHDNAVTHFDNIMDTRYASLPDYDSLQSLASAAFICEQALSAAAAAAAGTASRDTNSSEKPVIEEDLFGPSLSTNVAPAATQNIQATIRRRSGTMSNETRAKANLLISKISSIKRRLIERVALEISTTHADFSMGPKTRNEICKNLRNKLCRGEIHLSRVITSIIQEALGYTEYSLDLSYPEQSFLCMSVDDIEEYCASIITGAGPLEVPPAPPTTRATTPTAGDERESFLSNGTTIHAFSVPVDSDTSTADTSATCRNTLIFSASEEENLQDLLTDLQHLSPNTPTSPAASQSYDTESEELASVWVEADEFNDSNHGSTGTARDIGNAKVYEPMSPVSPFIGRSRDSEHSFVTSTPRAHKVGVREPHSGANTSMITDTMAITDASLLMDTTMIIDDSSLDTITGPVLGTASHSSGISGATPSMSRRWSAAGRQTKDVKGKGKVSVQEPNTPPQSPLGVVHGILRARAAHAERRQQRKQEKRAEKAGSAGAGTMGPTSEGQASTSSARGIPRLVRRPSVTAVVAAKGA